jgi:ABC-type phosphate transport system substrate-binding protein
MPTDSIDIRGDEMLVNLQQGWAEGFMKKNPGTHVQVNRGHHEKSVLTAA